MRGKDTPEFILAKRKKDRMQLARMRFDRRFQIAAVIIYAILLAAAPFPLITLPHSAGLCTSFMSGAAMAMLIAVATFGMLFHASEWKKIRQREKEMLVAEIMER